MHFVKIHQTLHLKSVHFTENKLHINEKNLNEHTLIWITHNWGWEKREQQPKCDKNRVPSLYITSGLTVYGGVEGMQEIIKCLLFKPLCRILNEWHDFGSQGIDNPVLLGITQ